MAIVHCDVIGASSVRIIIKKLLVGHSRPSFAPHGCDRMLRQTVCSYVLILYNNSKALKRGPCRAVLVKAKYLIARKISFVCYVQSCRWYMLPFSRSFVHSKYLFLVTKTLNKSRALLWILDLFRRGGNPGAVCNNSACQEHTTHNNFCTVCRCVLDYRRYP
jgi:hypothetical protein